MNVLLIAPHPDDEVLGCGGTLAKHASADDHVYLCIVTKGYHPDWSEKFLKERKKEIKKSNEILGINETYFLNYPTVRLDEISQRELNNALTKILIEIQPDILYIPHRGDLNKDHRLIFESALVAARPTNLKIKSILCYETLSVTEWGIYIEPFIPNVYIYISKTLDRKIKAMEAYESEVRLPPHPRSLEIIGALAKKRGSEAGVAYAESFMLIREVIE